MKHKRFTVAHSISHPDPAPVVLCTCYDVGFPAPYGCPRHDPLCYSRDDAKHRKDGA